MEKPIISVKNLGKRYLLGLGGGELYRTLRDVMTNNVKNLFKRNNKNKDSKEIWALKEISFDIRAGEKVGIIGRNGAGKSTLLKILSDITEPTEGEAHIHGRVASLLEVGTGFHPELTGKENIFMNGAILGMTRAEIKKKFDEIVAFAGVEKFLDTPVKRYSSGMSVRLAFAVAAHLEPEILLIDEVLAVGDAQFQKKCLGKMEDISKGCRTILFVSHNMVALQSLCERAICLQNGKIIQDGNSTQVVANYLKEFSVVNHGHTWKDIVSAPGNEYIRLRCAYIGSQDNNMLDNISVRTSFSMVFEYWNMVEGTRLTICLFVYDKQGALLFDAIPVNEKIWHGRPLPKGLFRSVCYVPGDLLNSGIHRVDFYAIQNGSIVIYHKRDVLVFEVKDSDEMRGNYFGEWPGSIRPILEWETTLIKT